MLFLFCYLYCTFLYQGQFWTILVTEKGVMQKYLPADVGECPAEAVLLWQIAANSEGAQRRGFVSRRWSPCYGCSVCRKSTSTIHPCQRWRRKHQEFPSSWVSQSLICSREWERKGTSSVLTTSGSSVEGWGHVLSLLYMYIRPEKFQLKVIFTSEWEACRVLDNRKEQREADSSLNIKQTNTNWNPQNLKRQKSL